MTFKALHVVVIGGGIGGLCLAQGLKTAGVSVAVYERNHPDTWLEGYRIHINPLGSRALYECLPSILWEVFLATAGKPPDGLGFLDEQLEELVVIAKEFMSAKTGAPVDAHHPISRITLRHLLLAGLQEEIHYGKTFERYEQTAAGQVTAFFADGTLATGDVLVAADGANSRVRKQYLPQAERIEAGAGAIGGKLFLSEHVKAWLPPQLAMRMNLIMGLGRYTLFNAVFDPTPVGTLDGIRARAKAVGLNPELLFDHTQSYLLWAFIAPASAYPAGMHSVDGSALQDFAREKIAGWHPDLYRLITESDSNSVSLQPFKTSVPMAPWESTNVTLLGDAIHNMPPVGGLGGNMALCDASQLARQLTAVQRDNLPLLPAIHAYEAEMTRRGFAAVQAVRGYTQQAVSSSRLAREVSKTWFRACNLLPPLKRVLEDRWTEHMRSYPERAIIH